MNESLEKRPLKNFQFLYQFSFLKKGKIIFLPQTKAGRGGGDLPPPHCQALRAIETSFATRRRLVCPACFCWAGEIIFRPVLSV
jgi:hypothetical protein